ncbi:hypothetical protein ACFL6C_05600 [Myxococcota bacterium]
MTTRLSEFVSPDTIEVQLRAQDFQGMGDHGGVRLFDGLRHKDVPLDVKKVIQNPRGPQDDLWVGTVPLAELPSGMDISQLKCTGWVDLDLPDGGKIRVWEGQDHDVTQPSIDQLVDIGVELPPGQYSRTIHDAVDTCSGKLHLSSYTRGEMSGSHTMSYVHGLKSIRFEDTTGFFNDADQLQVVVIPLTTHADYRGKWAERHLYVERHLRDLRSKNRVTLTRQQDGTYVALTRQDDGTLLTHAPPGKAFARSRGTDGYTPYQDVFRWRGYELAIVDPTTGKWDSNDSNNYEIDMVP